MAGDMHVKVIILPIVDVIENLPALAVFLHHSGQIIIIVMVTTYKR